jgi:Family of unknown function (DUF6481)
MCGRPASWPSRRGPLRRRPLYIRQEEVPISRGAELANRGLIWPFFWSRSEGPEAISVSPAGIYNRTYAKEMREALEHQHYLMSNRSVPNLEERLKHASEAKKLMLAKFKTSLVEGPAAIEKRQQPQAIAAARAEPYPKARGVPRPGTAGSGGAARSLACVDSF